MKNHIKSQKAIQIKEKINIDKVALIGRAFKEYERIFRLCDFRLKNISILDKEYESKRLELRNYFNAYIDGKSSERLLKFLKLI